MSRRRTTQKLHASIKEEKPTANEGPALATEVDKSGESDGRQHEDAIGSALGPWLASEAARRSASETRTTDALARYFKATLAILCLNMVVGGANVAVSFMNAGETRTVVVTQPAPTAVSQNTPAPAAAPPSADPSSLTEPTTPPAATPPPSQIPLLGKVPLLGKPNGPDARPSRVPAVTRPARAATVPTRSRPPAAAPEALEEEPAAGPSHLAAERW